MRYHLFQKFFGKMVKIKETSFLLSKCLVSITRHCTSCRTHFFTNAIKPGECMECFCGSNHVIISPNFPQRYPPYVNMKWLLKLFPGQTIKIDVQSFDLQAG